MFKALRDRADRALRSATARSAAETTYEEIRKVLVAAAPRTDAEVQRIILDALGKQRSWKRLSETEFECRFGRRTVRITVPIPFQYDTFFRRITRAEVDVFLGDSDPEMLRNLHMIAQRELEQLLDRDEE